MIVVPDGSIAWYRMARDVADNPPVEELLEALRAAARD
jgi:hypothetical protein